MATNEPDGSAIILINVFEVDPDRVEAFFSGWRERAELMCKREGFRSLRLNRAIGSDTHFQIINIAQWDSEAALKAAMAQQDWRGKVREDAQFANTPADASGRCGRRVAGLVPIARRWGPRGLLAESGNHAPSFIHRQWPRFGKNRQHWTRWLGIGILLQDRLIGHTEATTRLYYSR